MSRETLRRTRSAWLLRQPFQPGDPEHDRLFALAEIEERGKEVRLKVPAWVPTLALNADAVQRFAAGAPTSERFFAGHGSPGLLSVSAGLFLWEPGCSEYPRGRMLLLERDADAPIYPNHLTEPAGRMGELPHLTIEEEANQELLLVVSGPDPVTGAWCQRPLLLATSYETGLDTAAIAHKRAQVTERASELRACKIDAEKCLERDPLVVSLSPRAADAEHHRTVVVTIEGAEVARFQALVFVQPELRCVEIRRSGELVLPAWVERLTAIDGEAFGRRVARLSLEALGQAQSCLIPSLGAYRRLHTRPVLRVVASAG